MYQSKLSFLDEKLTLEAAVKRCQSQNDSQLVEIRDEEEWNEVTFYIYDVISFQRERSG